MKKIALATFKTQNLLWAPLAVVALVLLAFVLHWTSGERRPLAGTHSPEDFERLITEASSATFVLLGESSHGTSEYYTWRAEVTKRLIRDEGFAFVAVEGDWAAISRLNEYVKRLSDTYAAGREVLDTFDRWPRWMWANEEFLELVEWLREHNTELPPDDRVGVHGIDVQNVPESIEVVISYVRTVDTAALPGVEEAYECLLRFDGDPNAYIRSYAFEGISCEENVVRVVDTLRDRSEEYRPQGPYEYFTAKKNARVVKFGERYYRASAHGRSEGWNSRVAAMDHIVNRLQEFYGDGAKGIVWAHNTHVGDARATQMADVNMLNIGQLLREEHGEENVYIVGFGTHRGTVMAGRAWGAAPEVMTLPPAQLGSYEDLLHHRATTQAVLFLRDDETREAMLERRGHRAKGVVYDPENEAGNYVPTILAERYDAFVFIEETTALTPLP